MTKKLLTHVFERERISLKLWNLFARWKVFCDNLIWRRWREIRGTSSLTRMMRCTRKILCNDSSAIVLLSEVWGLLFPQLGFKMMNPFRTLSQSPTALAAKRCSKTKTSSQGCSYFMMFIRHATSSTMCTTKLSISSANLCVMSNLYQWKYRRMFWNF